LLTVAITAAVSGAGTTTAAAQVSSGTICVALVVDGTALGSNVSTSCATVPKGATGVDVLQAAGHTVGFRNDGLLCTIDGLPKTGCSAVDDTHFWAYFHRGPGKTSWTYSTEGASTYRPVNASTEGWVYRDGTDVTPENVPYAQICKTKATSSPSPSPSHKPSRHPTASPRPTHHAHSATPSPTPSAPPRRTASANRPERGDRHGHHRPRPTSTTADPGGTLSVSLSPSSAALAGGSTSTSGGGGSSTGLIIGIVVVLLLGGAAAYRFRRSGGGP
jgi:MYXO-CTERM domain-containing protein